MHGVAAVYKEEKVSHRPTNTNANLGNPSSLTRAENLLSLCLRRCVIVMVLDGLGDAEELQNRMHIDFV